MAKKSVQTPTPNKSPRRKFLLNVAAFSLLEGAGISGFIQQALAAGANPATPGLQRMKGDVRVNNKPAAVGMLIKDGDTITTGRASEAIYVIGQDAHLQRESSSVTFSISSLRIITGKLLSVFGKGAKQINVPTATIGIRGTGCYIEAEGEGLQARTYFCLCYGTADVVPIAAPQQQETLITQHHESPRYIYNDPKMPSTMVGATPINHTDLELVMLEALVGRTVKFPVDSYGERTF